ncbi:hypothetical protein Enr17x_45510 [Gimesia fumaroli]|uniref:Uncharacterized protein n=1 Tax=Gimesia fumaroli TaxID=2527976 RepID=A0A518IHC8_9PLAN|nr:hypothetical protein Enr17x_45510 [Gimesia fumaroli]
MCLPAYRRGLLDDFRNVFTGSLGVLIKFESDQAGGHMGPPLYLLLTV